MQQNVTNSGLNRRQFVSGALAAAAGAVALPRLGLSAESDSKPAEIKRKIKLGVVGQGGRGSWITRLFAKHGGYEIFGLADYFPEVVNKFGEEFGVDKARRFSGLGGYKKLIDCGVEAIALETPPYFIPIHAQAAAEAGLHLYMAKPVAVDAPGAIAIQEAGKLATQKKRCFLVDYQIPTDAINIEVKKRVNEGGLGKLAQILTTGVCGGFSDPPKTANLESRLQHLIWVNDAALGCDYIGNFDIHAIDAAIWVLGRRPVAAMGASSICREKPHGDARDVCSVVYEYADGLVHNHFGQALKNSTDGELSCRIFGQNANAMVNYWGKAYVRSGPKHYGGGEIKNLYQAGAERNIATFYENVVDGRTENPTFQRAVDGVLTCLLGREAALRRTRLTMDDFIKENKKQDVDLTGLKA